MPTAARYAVAYLRTSSASNIGADKDTHVRQLDAINAYADRAGIVIKLPPFYDAAVSGADPIDTRPGFAELLAFLREHPEVRTILVETANRFARDLIVQETGFAMLKAEGIELIAVDDPDAFAGDTPTAVMVRQILGAVAQFEKASLVAKLKHARDRKRDTTGKCEGRRSHAEIAPDAVAMARRLFRRSPKTGERRSLRQIAKEMAAAGFLSLAGTPYSASAIKSMVEA